MISGVISRIAIVMTHILITRLPTTHEPPSILARGHEV